MLAKFSVSHAATKWLIVAVTSIAFMGIYAFMIVLSRAPGFHLLFAEQDFFFTSLVTHVVLSIVIWFMAFILFMLYSVTPENHGGTLEQFIALGALSGVALIVATPFTGPASPELNNYVPTLNRGLYFTGLALFFGFVTAGVAFRSPVLLKEISKGKRLPFAITGSLATAGLSIAVGVICMFIAKSQLGGIENSGLSPRFYFEILFWGGGHVLQFANTLGMMAGWAYLTKKLTGEAIVSDKVAGRVFIFMIAIILIAPFQYVLNPADSTASRQFFTLLKGWGLGLGPIVFAFYATAKFPSMKKHTVAFRGLLLSMILFGMGGLIALTIDGNDTRIPAHYHGTIGGVTICYMTIGLLAMIENGWLDAKSKWVKRQITLYGTGQALFVVGMFIGGVQGLARKTYGQAQVLDTAEKVFSMGVMGIGGFMAIAGGGLFVILMATSLFRGRKATP